MASVEEPEFMKGPPYTHWKACRAALKRGALANQRFPEKPYCLVRDWTNISH